MSTACIFCAIARYEAPAEFVAEWPDAVAFRPLGPVTAGHVLVVPRTHVVDFIEDPAVSAATMRRAAQLAGTLMYGAVNLITSQGRAATQSVFHLHIHLVPRRKDDGLALPWYSGKGGHS